MGVDRSESRLERISAFMAATVVALSSTVLLGWLLGIAVLTVFPPGSVSMKTNAAVGFLAAGTGLLLLRRGEGARWRTLAGTAVTGLAVGIALLTLAQDLLGVGFGIDELLFEEARVARATGAPNRMAPNTAVTLALLGGAIWLRILRREQIVSEVLLLVAAFIGFVALLGYLYGASEAYWLGSHTAMGLHTAVIALLLFVAIKCARPPGPLARLLADPGTGGHLARRLLPAAIAIPSTLGALRLAGERLGIYDTAIGTAALTASTVVLFSAVAWWSATRLGHLEAARAAADRAARAESEARDLERRRLRAVLEALPVGVFLADASGRIDEVNEAARTIWGRHTPRVPKISDYGAYRAWRPGTGEPLKPEDWGLALTLTRGEVCMADELDIETFEGERKTILNYSVPIRNERGVLVGGVAVNVDITDRKRGERELTALKNQLEDRVRARTAELAAANAELEAFSYSVSHDLRAPLRWVDGFTRALADDYADRLDDAGREYVRHIRESVQRMAELIDALLRLSRVTRAPLARTEVDLTAMARQIAAELEASEPDRRVSWTIQPDLRARGDPLLLRVVLDNLLRNAWKFTRTRELAHIQVGAAAREGETAYLVRDDGVGFDMTYAAKLFRSFERLHRAAEFEGTGIGLALVKRVAQRHGGRVGAEGQLDRGATFWFTLGPPEGRG